MGHDILYLIPSGGLANRMRAVASGYWLSAETGCQLQIIWFRDWALKAPFYELFTPDTAIASHLREARFTDYLLYDRARRRNLWLPALPQYFLFDKRLREKEIKPLKLEGFDFVKWAKEGRCYMSNHLHFGDWRPALYHQLFHPVRAIEEGVQRLTEQFSTHTIGVHVRRGDNAYCIINSPVELYYKKIKEEIDKNNDTKVFLATDSEAVKQEMKKMFAGRIITVEKEASRGNVDGIRGGLIDLYSLAATSIVYGSAGSSFALTAAEIGGIEMYDLHS